MIPGWLRPACCLWVVIGIAVGSWAQESRPSAGFTETAPAGGEVGLLLRQSVELGVPERELSALVDACRRAGFTDDEIARVLRLVAGAKLAGLPHLDLMNKLGEGLAKGAPPEAIGAALEHKARSLRRAKGLVDALLLEGWSVADHTVAVQIVSDALEAGAGPSDVLRSVREGVACPDGVPDVRRAFRRSRGSK